MKRFFFTVIALAAVAVGCTKSGLLESPQTYEAPISFEPYTGKAPVTKATVVETNDIKTAGFRVIGFKEASDNTIASWYLDKEVRFGNHDSNNETAEKWYYDGAMFWPESDELSFVAYGLNASATITDEGETPYETIAYNPANKNTVLTYTVPSKVANQKDLVISPMKQNCTSKQPNGVEESTPGAVSIQLYHVLSRIGFQLKTAGTTGINVVIKNVSLKGVTEDKATFDLTNAVGFVTANGVTTVKYEKTDASADNTNVSYSLFDSAYAKGTTSGNFPVFQTTSSANTVAIYNNATLTAGTTPSVETTDNASADSRYMMILPQTLNATVEVIYQLEGAQEQVASLPVKEMEIEAGKAYEFVFTVSTNAVGFDVKVGDWATTTDKEYPLTPAE